MQAPSIGRNIHYVSHGSPILPDGSQTYPSVCRAAVVTEVGDGGRVGVAVLNPAGVFFHSLADGGCAYDAWGGGAPLSGAQPQGGSWHWPERVGE